MNVDVNMREEEKFHVDGWYATSPEFVVEALQRQLVAASAIWPDLKRARVEMESVGDEIVRVLEEARFK